MPREDTCSQSQCPGRTPAVSPSAQGGHVVSLSAQGGHPVSLSAQGGHPQSVLVPREDTCSQSQCPGRTPAVSPSAQGGHPQSVLVPREDTCSQSQCPGRTRSQSQCPGGTPSQSQCPGRAPAVSPSAQGGHLQSVLVPREDTCSQSQCPGGTRSQSQCPGGTPSQSQYPERAPSQSQCPGRTPSQSHAVPREDIPVSPSAQGGHAVVLHSLFIGYKFFSLQILCTHHVDNSLTPIWEKGVEIFVSDITQVLHY